jgi:hypothetical protein
MNGCCNLSRQGFGPSRRAKSGSTADTAAGGPRGGVTVTILNADKRTGTHVFTTVACAGRVTLHLFAMQIDARNMLMLFRLSPS